MFSFNSVINDQRLDAGCGPPARPHYMHMQEKWKKHNFNKIDTIRWREHPITRTIREIALISLSDLTKLLQCYSN